MRTRLIVGLTVMSVWVLGGQMLAAQDTHGKADVELMKALKGVKVSLADGLAASEREGTSISGKFELEEGKLQLSVYTMKDDTFSEVIVDHTTGNVTKVEPITSGKDLTDATAQRAALARTTKALRAVVTAALTGHPGAQAVSVTPKVQGDKAVAEITLFENGAMTTVSEPLGYDGAVCLYDSARGQGDDAASRPSGSPVRCGRGTGGQDAWSTSALRSKASRAGTLWRADGG